MFANNTDQNANPRSLISDFVIHYLESIICKLATGEFSILLLVSVAKKIGLKLALTDTPKTGFLTSRPIQHQCHNIYLCFEVKLR